MQHVKQISDCDCGAISYLMIVNHFFAPIKPIEACMEVKTSSSGTYIFNVLKSLEKRGLKCNLIELNVDYSEYFLTLELSSKYSLIYVAGEFRDRYFDKGRDRLRHHAFCVSDSYIFDPSQDSPIPTDAYFHIFTKKLIIKSLILIEKS